MIFVVFGHFSFYSLFLFMNETKIEFVQWQCYWDRKSIVDTPRGEFNVYSTENEKNDYLLFCIHGAGHSGLSFSLIAKMLKDVCDVVAPDLKCHGETAGNSSVDLSIENLVDDVGAIIEKIKNNGKKILIMGHSLGGTIATFVSYNVKPKGLFVIDTVEGTAMMALPGMKRILNSRPREFRSQHDAIRYVSSSGEMANVESAKVSVQGRVKMNDNGKYVWITDLNSSEKDWSGWFKGFGEKFIKLPVYKVLMLTNINNMDKTFIIGHMSGKFQLEIVKNANHCLHEDNPEAVTRIVSRFIQRISEVIPKWELN